jgi:FkbM family methyltransferase
MISGGTPPHAQLRRLAQLMYAMPGARPLLRTLVRVSMQHTPLSRRGKQRLFNFFARDVSPCTSVRCSVNVPKARALRLDLQLGDDLSRNWYFWGYGGFESGLTRLFRHLLSSTRLVFDVGANVGYYTLMAASVVEGHGEVHAFEPVPHVFDNLLGNAKLNQFRCLRLNQCALADVDGEAPLFIPDNAAWSNASLVSGYAPAQRSIRTRVLRFDTYCLSQNVERVDLIKIDVEGAELAVLRGMGSLLHAWRPDIVLEVLAPFAAELDQFFQGTLYRKFLVTDDGLHEMSRITADAVYRDVYLSCAPKLPVWA